MIDWNAKVVELKAMVDELEMWAGKTEGHLRSMLGRNADELRSFVRQIESEIVPTERAALEPPPGWVTDSEMPPGGEQTDSGEGFEPQG